MSTFRPERVLVPYAANYPVDQQDRVVAGLAGWGERPSGRLARVQPVAWLSGDDEGVEVGQEAYALVGPVWGLGVAGQHPAGLTVHLDAFQAGG